MYEISIGNELDAAMSRVLISLSPAGQTQVMGAAGRAAGVSAEGFVSPYPLASGKPLAKWYTRTDKQGKTYQSKFKSLKQQRYVLALAARGAIPYRRTGTLGKSITSDVENATADGVTVRVGSNYKGAPYVIDRYRQSHYHTGTWATIQDDIEAHLPEISQAANQAAAKEIRTITTTF